MDSGSLGDNGDVEHIDLKQMFPLQKRAAIRFSFWELVSFIFLFISSAILYALVTAYVELGDRELTYVFWMCLAVSGLSFMWWFVKYWRCRFTGASTRFGIQGHFFYFSQGFMWRKRIMLPLNKITDIYLRQTRLDMLFRLIRMEIVAPGAASREITGIEALDVNLGSKLQEFLLAKVEEQRSDS